MPINWSHFCQAKLDEDRQVFIGGEGDSVGVPYLRTFYILTVQAWLWTKMADMSLERHNPACGTYKSSGGVDMIVVAGGKKMLWGKPVGI